MKRKRYNNFKRACIKYNVCLVAQIQKTKNFNLTEELYTQVYNDIPIEDKFIYELMRNVDNDVLYRSPEFNRQLRLRMKYYKLPWK